MIYLDSSAAVKLYIAEVGSAELMAAVAADPARVTARITFVEVAAALAAAARVGRLADLASAMSAFRADWAGLVVVDLDQLLAESAAVLATRHALRGYDAVQLAAAFAVVRGNPTRIKFATFDDALSRAAAAEGFPTSL